MDGLGVVVLLAAIGFVLWILSRSSSPRGTVTAPLHDGFPARAEAAREWINAIDELPTVDPDGLNLHKGEVCYWAGDCKWYERRTHTRRISYHGPTASIPVVKGVRYRIGSIAPSIDKVSELSLVDSGRLYITNKRLFFDGSDKNATLSYGKIVRISLFDGGFVVERDAGRSPCLAVSPEPERAAVVAVRAHQVAKE